MIQPRHRKTPLSPVAAWSLYDFANSPFTTLVVTFVYATFFTKEMAPDEVRGTALWSRGVTVTAVVVAVASPILGSIADRGGYRRGPLLACTLICSLATTALFFPRPVGSGAGADGQTLWALGLFVVANVAFELAMVFYNAMLPGVAEPERLGRVSAYGWALGYVGGLLCMALAFVGFVFPDDPWFGFEKAGGEHIRATNLLVAVWYLVFSVPIFLFVRSDRAAAPPPSWRQVVRSSFADLARTYQNMRTHRQVIRLLVARLVYNDGLVTVFAFGGIYAAVTFGFTFSEVMVFGIALNVTAGVGAFLMGWVDDRMGGKRTILITLGGLGAATLLAVVAPNKMVFWAAGILVGVFSGPNQAASRSLLARFTPVERRNEFFGFFAFSGKATSFLGPLLFGLLTEQFQSQRAGIVAVLGFFVVGALVLVRVDEREGVAAARGSSLPMKVS